MNKKSRKRINKQITLAGQPNTHNKTDNREAMDLPINSVVAPVVADDPYELGAKITVLRSLRNDPLAAMHNARQIDQAQYIAGRHWQRAYELAEVGGAKAIDTTREPVDGGGIAQATITDAQIRAFGDLARAMTALGQEGENLVRDFLGHCWTLRDIAASRGAHTERERTYVGWRVRECLNTLAVEFGYAGRNQQPARRIV